MNNGLSAWFERSRCVAVITDNCNSISGGVRVEFEEIKSLLESVLNADKLIDTKLVDIEELRRRLQDVKSPSFGDRVQSTKDPDKFTDVISKIIEMEKEVNDDIDKLIDNKNACRRLIESLESNFYKVVLYKIYFEGKSLKTLADSLKMSVRQIARIRNKAIVQISKNSKNNDDFSKCP